LIKVAIDIQNLINRLEKGSKKIKNLKKVFFDIAIYMQRKTAETFQKEGARDGQPLWEPFSENTLYDEDGEPQKRPSGKFYTPASKLLQDTGNLKNSFVIKKLVNNELIFGSSLKYAKKHQMGFKSLPARQMLFITETDRRESLKKFVYWSKI